LASLLGSKNSRPHWKLQKKAVAIFQKRGRRGRNTRLRAPKNKERTDRILFNAIKASESNFVLRATLSKEEGGGKKSEEVVPLMSKSKSRSRKKNYAGERFLFFERTAFFHFKNYSETAREEHTDGRNAR
jgi:hypothetical protein